MHNDIAIVSGLPRCGTSMMMQMIAAGGIAPLTDGIRGADVDNLRGYFEFEPVKKTKQDASWLQQAPGKVVKMVHLLLLDLPEGFNYRVVMMCRELSQVLASQDAMLQRQGKKGADLAPQALSHVYRKQLQKVEAAVASRPDMVLLNVHYGDVMRHAQHQAERVDTFLGRNLNVSAMVAAVDPSLQHQES